MPNVSHLRSLQALELAVRTGSLKSAADALALTPAALGQRIKQLEDYLGYDLLVRGRSGIRPTRELDAALAHLRAAFRELDTVSGILDFQKAHEIHIVADTDWAELWLKPRLPAFRKLQPNTRFCINGVGDVPVRLGQADCKIWFGEPNGEGEEHALFRDYLVPVSSPANNSRISNLARDERLEGFPLLHLDCYKLDHEAIGWPDWVARHGYRTTAPERGIRYLRIVHALEAVYSDAGLILCGLALVSEIVRQGALSLPFPLSQGAWTGHSYQAWFREGATRRGQVAQFRDWLVREGKKSERQITDALGSTG